MLLNKAEFNDRDNLPEFLNELGLTGRAVEIGTHQADFASLFYRKWKGQHLTCVDPWATMSEYYDQSKCLWNSDPDNRDKDYAIAKQKMDEVGKPYRMLKMTSLEASKRHDLHELDFVYLDGNHEYRWVRQDLFLWWDHLKPGGVLAGHDIICPGEDAGWGKEIQPAVFEFATERSLTVNLIVESKWLPWSYYIKKES